ncbi:DUF1684 domain-containing protein [Ferruginibacter lapsinanis]|uniref:DUF1684 domain-containing protein n=1 Tax=Ferruginibacter lapsinanis TaxID=563172 RepID=UPI001E599822|nr:DUF1684 domain-containing protein [Ferruginibacter lapsinanis]UEG48749.1 DUF1684 domain-containing protein [Ferruginibacter lapsinanis]
MNKILFACCIFLSQLTFAQTNSGSYIDKIKEYQRMYIATHEVVKGQDRNEIHFFAPDSNYKVVATFEKINDAVGFKMPTSAKSMQQYYRYGKISFVINDKTYQLIVYQSKDMILTDEYKDYLFIPFTDATNGNETYEGGRYIDILITDIADNKVVIDFNKAYNPYCCYATGYHCPIPPKENALTVAINAGEKKYTKAVH